MPFFTWCLLSNGEQYGLVVMHNGEVGQVGLETDLRSALDGLYRCAWTESSLLAIEVNRSLLDQTNHRKKDEMDIRSMMEGYERAPYFTGGRRFTQSGPSSQLFLKF